MPPRALIHGELRDAAGVAVWVDAALDATPASMLDWDAAVDPDDLIGDALRARLTDPTRGAAAAAALAAAPGPFAVERTAAALLQAVDHGGEAAAALRARVRAEAAPSDRAAAAVRAEGAREAAPAVGSEAQHLVTAIEAAMAAMAAAPQPAAPPTGADIEAALDSLPAPLAARLRDPGGPIPTVADFDRAGSLLGRSVGLDAPTGVIATPAAAAAQLQRLAAAIEGADLATTPAAAALRATADLLSGDGKGVDMDALAARLGGMVPPALQADAEARQTAAREQRVRRGIDQAMAHIKLLPLGGKAS